MDTNLRHGVFGFYIKEKIQMSDTIKKIRETAPSYGSIPFWSWNDRLEEGELRRQIARMQ